MARNNYTTEQKEQVCDIVHAWMKKHNCHSGEDAYQDDDCQVYAIDLAGELADVVGIPYEDD